MRDQNVGSLNGTIQCTAASLTNSEGSTIPSITSPLQYVPQQQHSPDFNVNSMRPRTSSNASSITGFDGDQFRDRSASNASSCGGAVGVNGHLSPPSLADYSEQDSMHSGVCIRIIYINYRLNKPQYIISLVMIAPISQVYQCFLFL